MLTPAIPPPQSCDTFVYVVQGSGTLFGKNSDRPSDEHHEVIRIPRMQHKEADVAQCTFISVPQAKETLECILSRPTWLWGCEMGANEAGVVGGNEAIYTLLADELVESSGTPTKSLLGMDILRLALERGSTAKEAVEVCIHLLETYGQGGPCSQDDADWTYENSFFLEAYVLETAGKNHWIWERIGPGEHRNISNGISIREDWGGISKDIQAVCKENGWWDGSSTKFDWKCAVGSGGTVEGLESCGGREAAGLRFMKRMQSESVSMQSPPSPKWWVEQMANTLRDEVGGICFRDRHGFCSTGSQISWLPTISPDKGDNVGKEVASHFFTGASDPLCGTTYKLFRWSDPMRNNGDDHGTNRLWNLWRNRALSRKPVIKSLGDRLSKMENESLSLLEIAADADTKEQSTFAEMVQREIELLESRVA